MRIAALTGILIAVTAPAGRADDWARQYAVGGRPEVRILTDEASVTVASSERRDVEVRVTTQGWAIGPEGARIIENQAGNRVEVEVRLPHRGWGFGNTGHRSVKVELSVPREADLEVRTGDGSVSLQPISGRVSVETGDGSIKAEGLKGDVRLRTGDGGIDASGLDASLHAATGDGHLRVGGRFDVLELRTGDGSIDAEVEPGSRASGAWALHSGDGSITLGLPPDFGAELDAHTGDGHITVDLPVTVAGRISSSTVRGRLNGGGSTVTLRSGDGSIHLRSR